MLTANQLKNNVCFIYNGKPCRVLKYKHTHLGRGGGDVKVKVKNLVDKSTLALNFGSGERFEEASLSRRKLQFLYKDQELHFMDPGSFEQIDISRAVGGLKESFLQEGLNYQILYWEDEPIDLELPSSVILVIKKCDPGVKGNSATNIFKSAVAENGLKLKVPLFIKVGDKVKVDTESGEYVERAK